MVDRIDELESEAASALAGVAGPAELEVFRQRFLGPKGSIKGLLAGMKDVPAEQRPAFGQRANALAKRVEGWFEERKAAVGGAGRGQAKPRVDVTLPGLAPRAGRIHPITQVMDDLVEVFGRMGFDVATGPELEDERHNFVALNIPPEHPARDPLDNYYLDDPRARANPMMLRSQTSTIQVRVMEKQPPPVRVVALGRVYRPDEADATHYSMFHQIEGLYVDRGVTLVDLKSTLMQFARAYFGPESEVRLRPSYFPFTEPSAEFDIRMKVRDAWRWVELGGCGMVDPNVFRAVGYDPEEWTGFAFGLGIERIAMRRFGVSDIRLFFESDNRFLRQF
jgi:phenylalanyl-tRNA synthetase alpha chain